MTPLHLAAFAGHSKVLSQLIQRKGNINEKANHGWLPLHLAAANGHLESVKVILESGGQINSLKVPQNSTALHLACKEGHLRVAEYLIQNGADLNIVDSLSRKPIDVAASRIKITFSLHLDKPLFNQQIPPSVIQKYSR